MLSCQRASFFLPGDLHYLNCAYMAPQSRRVEAAGLLGLRRKRNPAEIGAESFFVKSDAVRERFAALVGIRDPQRVAILAAASYGLSAAARNTPVEAGQNVVVLSEGFPSNFYTWSRRCRDQSAELRVIPPPTQGSGRGARLVRRRRDGGSGRAVDGNYRRVPAEYRRGHRRSARCSSPAPAPRRAAGRRGWKP